MLAQASSKQKAGERMKWRVTRKRGKEKVEKSRASNFNGLGLG
jgi:hypothetical protein